jgi:hypothetical protein
MTYVFVWPLDSPFVTRTVQTQGKPPANPSPDGCNCLRHTPNITNHVADIAGSLAGRNIADNSGARTGAYEEEKERPQFEILSPMIAPPAKSLH